MTDKLRLALQWWREGEPPEAVTDWPVIIGAGLVFALVSVLTLSTSSYWLHFDDPTQHLAGLLLLKGWQWPYSGNKALLMGVNTLLIVVFGPQPLSETLLSTTLGIIATAAFLDLARNTFRSRRAALIALFLWLSLLVVHYYFRTHIGFPLGFFLIGIALYRRGRFLAAGILLTLAVLSHVSFVVPVALWCTATLLVGAGPRKLIDLGKLVIPPVVIFLGYEYIALRGSTELFHTTHNFLRELALWRNISFPEQPLFYLLELIRTSNGLPMTLLLIGGLLGFPLVMRSESRTLRASWLVALVMLVVFIYRSGVTHENIMLRVVAGTFPFMVLCSAALLDEGLTRLTDWKLSALRFGIVVLVLVGIVHGGLVVSASRACSVSAWPVLKQTFVAAAAADRPVLYNGNEWAAAYYRASTGASVLIDPGAPPLAQETINTVGLDDLDLSQGVVVVWSGEPGGPDNRIKEALTTLYGGPVDLRAGDVQGYVQPFDGCGTTLAENWSMPLPVLREAHPLFDAFRQPNPSLFVWLVDPPIR